MGNVKKSDIATVLLKLVSASDQHLAGQSIVLDGKVWKTVDLVGAFQGHIDEMHAVDLARQTWLKQAGDVKTSYKTVIVPLVKALRSFVALQFGIASQTYLDFGFPAPRPRAKPGIVTAGVALVQRLATRKARHTMGKIQRLAIKGIVSPANVAPIGASPSQTANGPSHT